MDGTVRTSPFDAIRHVDEKLGEYWSARQHILKNQPQVPQDLRMQCRLCQQPCQQHS
jgi:hypothetical protein